MNAQSRQPPDAVAAELAAVLRTQVTDVRSTWSCGGFGAIAEFARDHDEACEVFAGDTIGAVTARGALRIDSVAEIVPVAYETVGPEPDGWRQGLALCLPRESCAMGNRRAFTDLGADADAIGPDDRAATLFDIGLGVLQADICIRVGDPNAIRALRAFAGTPLWATGGELMRTILALNPARVMRCRFGRIEVYAPIPREDGESPQGPHTHVLPKLLSRGLTHAANLPIPANLVPCMSLFPPSPLADALGERKPFDRGAYDAFARLWERFADPELVAIKSEVFEATRTGRESAVTNARFARAAAEIARRQLRHVHEGAMPVNGNGAGRS